MACRHVWVKISIAIDDIYGGTKLISLLNYIYVTEYKILSSIGTFPFSSYHKPFVHFYQFGGQISNSMVVL
jgi:hypothetical protein